MFQHTLIYIEDTILNKKEVQREMTHFSDLSNLTHSALPDNVDGVHMHLENKKLSRKFFWFLWVMYAAVYMTKSCFTAAMASMVSEGIITKSQTGIITSVFYIIYGILQLAGGVMADKYNPERIIKLSLIGGAIANIVIFLNSNFYVMLAAWSFNAATQFALWPCVFKIISSQLVRSDRKMMIFYISYGVTIGLFMSYLVAIFVTKWQYNFAVSAAVLLIFALLLHIIYRRVEPNMLPDRKTITVKTDAKVESPVQMSTVRLFLVSGFFIMCLVTFARVVVDNGIKTLSPTMLMESYEHVSPRLGNALGLIIIIASMAGMVFVRLLHPKFIKNELVMHLIIVFLSVPFALALRFIGKVSVPFAILSLCVLSAAFTGMRLLVYNYNARFAEYGKDGSAAAVSNMAESFAITAESYGFTYLAEYFGWGSVTGLCFFIITMAIPLNIAAILIWKRFRKK